MLKRAAEEADVSWEFGASKGVAYYAFETNVSGNDDMVKQANKAIFKSKKAIAKPRKLNNRQMALLGIKK